MRPARHRRRAPPDRLRIHTPPPQRQVDNVLLVLPLHTFPRRLPGLQHRVELAPRAPSLLRGAQGQRVWETTVGKAVEAHAGRLGDSVRCRGENVSAWEVERVTAAHPDVEDCAMIGVAAEIGEQDIKLFVQPKPGASINPTGLSHWLADRLAAYQNPRYIVLVDRFERTPSQRIIKRDLPRHTEGCWDRLAGR
jgi:hypothetical protein